MSSARVRVACTIPAKVEQQRMAATVVVSTAARGSTEATGWTPQAPLSGRRAFRAGLDGLRSKGTASTRLWRDR